MIFPLSSKYERQHGLNLSNEEEPVMVNVVDGKKFSGNFGKNKGFYCGKICTHCGKTRHTIDSCYRKHGFPPNYSSRIMDLMQIMLATMIQRTKLMRLAWLSSKMFSHAILLSHLMSTRPLSHFLKYSAGKLNVDVQ